MHHTTAAYVETITSPERSLFITSLTGREYSTSHADPLQTHIELLCAPRIPPDLAELTSEYPDSEGQFLECVQISAWPNRAEATKRGVALALC